MRLSMTATLFLLATTFCHASSLTLAEADAIIVVLIIVVFLLLILGGISLYYNKVVSRRNEQLLRILNALDNYRAIVADGALSLDKQEEMIKKTQSKLKKAKAHKSKVRITWKKPSRAEIKKYTITGYEVQYSKDRGFGSEVAAKVLKKGKSSYTFKGQQSTKYYVRIRYVGAGGASPWSAVKEVTTKK